MVVSDSFFNDLFLLVNYFFFLVIVLFSYISYRFFEWCDYKVVFVVVN